MRLAAALLVFSGGAAGAQDLPLPGGAELAFRNVQDPGVYALPTGPWRPEGLPVERVEGRIAVEAWHLPDAAQTPFELVRPLRDALAAAGYEIVLDCAARACGGFDFRFATLVLPAPEMFVTLTDYHAVAALSAQGGVSVLASRDGAKGYVQIIRATRGPAGATVPDVPSASPASPRDGSGIGTVLEERGHVALDDLVFSPGSTELGEGPIASLDAIAAYLEAHPSRQVLFVGHTDATGSLDTNRAVSLRRARAALTYLRDRHGTPAGQISAEGAGYLSPVASNLTLEGREANRRVEAVLISTE